MQLKDFLIENEQPKKFWLVFDIPNWEKNPDERIMNRIRDIANGEFRGLRGISGSREIMTQMWMVARNAAVVMDSEAVLALNDIEQIRYDDVEYLCRNDFGILFRIFDQHGRYAREQVMMRIGDYLIKAMYTENKFIAQMLAHDGMPSRLGDEWMKYEKRIDGFDDAVKHLYPLLRSIKGGKFTQSPYDGLSEELFRNALRKGLLLIGKTYSDEAEWIVHGDTFKIPPKSPLLVGVDFEVVRRYREWQENPDKLEFRINGYRYENYDRLVRIIHENRLHERYRVKLVDARKWEEVRPQVMTRRRNKV